MTTLSDEDVLELRKAARAGVRARELAARFGISRAYVYELAAGRARPTAVAADTDPAPPAGAATRALDAFVDSLGPLRGERAALAALAALLADRLDAVAGVDSAAGVAAAERVAGRLVAIVERLADGEAREGAEMAARRMLEAIT
jgi:hypothetical protein